MSRNHDGPVGSGSTGRGEDGALPQKKSRRRPLLDGPIDRPTTDKGGLANEDKVESKPSLPRVAGYGIWLRTHRGIMPCWLRAVIAMYRSRYFWASLHPRHHLQELTINQIGILGVREPTALHGRVFVPRLRTLVHQALLSTPFKSKYIALFVFASVETPFVQLDSLASLTGGPLAKPLCQCEANLRVGAIAAMESFCSASQPLQESPEKRASQAASFLASKCSGSRQKQRASKFHYRFRMIPFRDKGTNSHAT